MEKELKINVPEGYEIDKENSTFECIKFKKKDIVKWRNSGQLLNGYWIDSKSDLQKVIENLPNNIEYNNNVFPTKQLAKSALAMAQIGQIIENDERFGGPVTDDEWKREDLTKYIIKKYEGGKIGKDNVFETYFFLAFHTEEQRDLFLEENKDLVEDYLMID